MSVECTAGASQFPDIPAAVLVHDLANGDLSLGHSATLCWRLTEQDDVPLRAALTAANVGIGGIGRVIIYTHDDGALRLATATGTTLALLPASDTGPLRRAVAGCIARRVAASKGKPG